MRVLISGWFSFEQMGATAGDLLSRDVVCDWLTQSKVPYDISLTPPFNGGVSWEKVDQSAYTHVIFICGPFGNGWPLIDFLKKFSDCKLVGINLSMLQALNEWNPFEFLLERDSSRTTRPDLAFLSQAKKVPIVGKILVEPQKEYRENAQHAEANEIIDSLIQSNRLSCVTIDTRLDTGKNPLRTPEEIESLIARMDAVLTTRLHGMVLSIKNEVPVLAIDPIKGGAKISAQGKSIEWPNVYTVDQLNSESELTKAFDFCFTNEAKLKVQRSKNLAFEKMKKVEKEFLTWLDTQ